MNSSNDFAQKILEKELELESNCSLETLNRLVESYRSAIEHFEEIKSSKLYDYQERLQKILMRPQILQLMQDDFANHRSHQRVRTRGRAQTEVVASCKSNFKASGGETPKKPELSLPTEPSTPKSFEMVESPKSLKFALNESPKEEKTEKSENSETIQKIEKNEKALNRMVESHLKRTEHVTNKAVVSFETQESSLNERLKNRKQKGLNITTDTSFSSSKPAVFSMPPSPLSSHKEFFFDVESDKSGGVNVFSVLHEKIEKIMEDSFSQKTEKITAVKVRYGTQIGELEVQGGIFDEIIKQMKINMSQEIEEISRSIDENRKQLINEAKRELGLIHN